jgi:DNA invertase Pin-like site-specific DNA recombinase
MDATKARAPTARRQAAEVLRLKGQGMRATEIAAMLSIGRASVYRILGSRPEQAGSQLHATMSRTRR